MSEENYISIYDNNAYVVSPLFADFSLMTNDEFHQSFNRDTVNENYFAPYKRLIKDNRSFRNLSEAQSYAKKINRDANQEMEEGFITHNLATLRYRIITLVGKLQMITEDELIYKLQVMVSKDNPLKVSKRKFDQVIKGLIESGLLQVWRIEVPTDNSEPCYIGYSLTESGGMVYVQFNYTDTRFIDAYSMIKLDQSLKKKYFALSELIIQMTIEFSVIDVRKDYIVNGSKPNTRPEHLINLEIGGHKLQVLLDRLIGASKFVSHLDRQVSKLAMQTNKGEEPLELNGDKDSPKLLFYSIGSLQMLTYIAQQTQSLQFSPIPVVFLNEQEYIEEGITEAMYTIKDGKIERFKL